MTKAVIGAFKDNELWWQSPESVAKIIVGLEARIDMQGKAIYIEGGDGWEFEDSLYEYQSQWLGEEPTRRMRTNAEAVNRVREPVHVFLCYSLSLTCWVIGCSGTEITIIR